MKETKLRRDIYSKAVLNTDGASYKQHRYDELKSRELNETVKEVKTLKNDVNEIKEMLRLLLDGKNNG
ncbi:hypothetical protein EB118_21040 [bacterium]|nr:hypothetical protein [bacterium]NDD83865.1 hypothetical protein [bacterium]NDG32545.1 hypothetical protein [bacterium]